MPSQVQSIMDDSSPSAGTKNAESAITAGVLTVESAKSLSADSAKVFDVNSSNNFSQLSPESKPPVKNVRGVALTGKDCMVCADTAQGIEFRRHYGVICCEACKCFFRRTVQMNRDYKCRFGGSCYVGRTTENLKQVCQACRFNQCIRAGMKLDSVKRFPRKPRGTDANRSQTPGQQGGSRNAKTVKAKRQKSEQMTEQVSIKQEPLSFSAENDRMQQGGGVLMSPPGAKLQDNGDLRLSDTDLANVKFKMSTSEAMLYLQSASTSVTQLFKYDSSENINEKTDGGDSKSNPEINTNSTERLNLSSSGTSSTVINVSRHVSSQAKNSNSSSENGCDLGKKGAVFQGGKRGIRGEQEENVQCMLPGKKQCREEHEGGGGGGITLMIPGGSNTQRINLSPNSSATSNGGSVTPGGNGSVLGQYHRSVQLSTGSSLSTPPITPLTPLTPTQSHDQSSSRLNSPELEVVITNSNDGNNNNISTYNSPYVTPHGTPVHTPHQSPLSSPTRLPHPSTSYQFPPGFSKTGRGLGVPMETRSLAEEGMVSSTSQARNFHFSTSSPSTLNSMNLTGFTHLQPQTNTRTIFFNSNPPMPFQVFTPPLVPMVLSAHHPPMGINSQLLESGGNSSKSPFRIVPIPSINRTQPEELPIEPEVVKSSDSPDRRGEGPKVPGTTPPSACSSPVHSKPKKFTHLAEAELEEVLDSLRLRIRFLFTWAKSDVSGFDDLSPLDQKALLRRTVPELVMLGFARGSIAYNDLLLLGSTGKVIRPTNQNSGVASVAAVTLQKLVVPLKVLNINDREFTLLEEIVLFNPESNGLRNREVVRQYRKNKHLKLMDYTEKYSDDPGRFGELMCLLTPLFEVSTEVTEQLRLEQFVHEGEARIDALLLMSMISGADEIPDENTLDSQL